MKLCFTNMTVTNTWSVNRYRNFLRHSMLSSRPRPPFIITQTPWGSTFPTQSLPSPSKPTGAFFMQAVHHGAPWWCFYYYYFFTRRCCRDSAKEWRAAGDLCACGWGRVRDGGWRGEKNKTGELYDSERDLRLGWLAQRHASGEAACGSQPLVSHITVNITLSNEVGAVHQNIITISQSHNHKNEFPCCESTLKAQSCLCSKCAANVNLFFSPSLLNAD